MDGERVGVILRVRRHLASALVLVAWSAVALATAAFANTRFMVNDDQIMAAFASGDFTGRPSAHLVFIGIVPGVIVSRLYMVAGAVPWYTVMLYSAGVLALSIVSLVWHRHRRRWTLEVHLILALATFTWMSVLFVQPTFTVAAMSVTFAAIVALVDCAARRVFTTPRLAAVVALLAASASLRFDAFLGGLAVAMPVAALCATRMGWRRLLLFAAVLGGGLLALTVVDHAATNSDWAAFEELNEIRGTMHGTGELGLVLRDAEEPDVQAMLQRNDWTNDDLLLFARYFIDDPAVYDVDTLSRLREATGSRSGQQTWTQSWTSVEGPHRPLLGLFLAGVLALGVVGWRSARFALGQLVWTASVCLWVAHEQRFPTRVAVPLLVGSTVLVCTAQLLLTSDEPTSNTKASLVRFVVFGTAIAAFVAVPLRPYFGPGLSESNRQRLQHAAGNVAAIRALDPGGTFVIIGGALDIAADEPTRADGPFAWGGAVTTGWHSQSPSQLVRLRHAGLRPEIVPAAAGQEHVWIVAKQRDVQAVVRVARQRYGLDVDAEVGLRVGASAVFRLVLEGG